MDVQLKRGMLEACVLALLSRGDSYGYRLSQDAAHIVEISESTLYPILKRLESAGAVDVYRKEFSGRLRKYYRITPAGFSRMDDFLKEWKVITRVYDFILEESVRDKDLSKGDGPYDQGNVPQ